MKNKLFVVLPFLAVSQLGFASPDWIGAGIRNRDGEQLRPACARWQSTDKRVCQEVVIYQARKTHKNEAEFFQAFKNVIEQGVINPRAGAPIGTEMTETGHFEKGVTIRADVLNHLNVELGTNPAVRALNSESRLSEKKEKLWAARVDKVGESWISDQIFYGGLTTSVFTTMFMNKIGALQITSYSVTAASLGVSLGLELSHLLYRRSIKKQNSRYQLRMMQALRNFFTQDARAVLVSRQDFLEFTELLKVGLVAFQTPDRSTQLVATEAASKNSENEFKPLGAGVRTAGGEHLVLGCVEFDESGLGCNQVVYAWKQDARSEETQFDFLSSQSAETATRAYVRIGTPTVGYEFLEKTRELYRNFHSQQFYRNHAVRRALGLSFFQGENWTLETRAPMISPDMMQDLKTFISSQIGTKN